MDDFAVVVAAVAVVAAVNAEMIHLNEMKNIDSHVVIKKMAFVFTII